MNVVRLRLINTNYSGLMSTIPSGPPATYLTLLLRNAGRVWTTYSHRFAAERCYRFNTFNTNLLTMPSQVIAIFNMFLITLVSESVSERTFVSMLENVWILPFLVALYALPSTPNSWLFFVSITYRLSESLLIVQQGLITGLLSHPYVSLDLSCEALAERTGLSLTGPIHVS